MKIEFLNTMEPVMILLLSITGICNGSLTISRLLIYATGIWVLVLTD